MQKKWSFRELGFFLIAWGVVLIFCVLPPFSGLSESAMMVLGIFLASVFLWIAVGISWPSLLCLLMLAFLPEISMNTLIASSMGNSAISFLIFTFCCSNALNKTPFTRRCAIAFLSSRLARKGPWWFLSLYFLSILALGSCMSTTVIVLIYLIINDEIFALLGLKKGDPFAAMMTMGLVITASISGAMTPVAHVFPLMALSIYESITGQAISYAAYMAGGIPAALVSVAAMMLIFRFLLKPDTSSIQKIDIQSMKCSLPKAELEERLTVGVFATVVILWVVPDLVKGLIPEIAAYISSFGTVGPPLLGAIVLCVLCPKGKPLLELSEAVKTIPWTSLFMAASALALGSAMTNADIGLSAWLKEAIAPSLSGLNGMLLILLVVAVTGIMTNVGSNMVTVTIMTTVAVPIALSLGESVNAMALAVVIGMMSTYAFATPPAMTTVVLGTGSGWTTNAQMAKYGFLILIPCTLAVTLIAYPIACLF